MTEADHIYTDHRDIRSWIVKRDGEPAILPDTGENEHNVRLVIDFHGGGNDELSHLSWEDFFLAFEEQNLAFVCQDHNAFGEVSRFCSFVDRKSLQLEEGGEA